VVADTGSNSVDVMEKLEAAGRGYLGGQCFSDDTDSHDEGHPSPPQGGVATTKPSSSHNGHGIPSSQGEQVHSSPNLVATKEGRNGFSHQTATSPRSIPHQGVPFQPHGPATSQSQPWKKTGSTNLQQPHGTPKGQSVSPVIGHQRATLHHSASFDQARNYRMTHREPTGVYGGGGRSNSMFGGNLYPYAGTPVAAPGRMYHSAYLPSRSHSAAAGGGGPSDDSIVRRLFSEVPASSTAVSSAVGSVSLQTLFSQAQPTAGLHLSYSTGSLRGLPHQHHHAPPPLVPARSLDEIEKQMTEEARSPNGLGPTDSGLKMAALVKSSGGESTVLLQPSAFIIPPPPSSTSLSATETPKSQAVSITEPQVFPAIPPLVPSAGMTAPPLTTQPGSLTMMSSSSSSSSPAKALQTSTVGSNQQIQPTSRHTPKGKAPATPSTKEALSAIPEGQMPPNRSTTAPAGGSSVS
jgi:hypothetical protein